MAATPETIQVLARQAARWATAASQDANLFIANLHANYGAAYIFALRQVAADSEIRATTGLDAVVFEREVVNVQDAAARRLLLAAPRIAPKGALAKVAGEGTGLTASSLAPTAREYWIGVAANVTVLLVAAALFARRRSNR